MQTDMSGFSAADSVKQQGTELKLTTKQKKNTDSQRGGGQVHITSKLATKLWARLSLSWTKERQLRKKGTACTTHGSCMLHSAVQRKVESNLSSNKTASHLFHGKMTSGSHWCQKDAHSLLTLTIPKNMNFNVDFDSSKEHQFYCLPHEMSITDSPDLL